MLLQARNLNHAIFCLVAIKSQRYRIHLEAVKIGPMQVNGVELALHAGAGVEAAFSVEL